MTMTRKTCITVAAAAALCFGIAFSAYASGVGAAAEKAVTGVSESSAGQATAEAAKGVTDAAKGVAGEAKDAAAEVITNAKDKAVGMAKEQANKAVDAATQKATDALTGTEKAAGAAADAVKGAAK